MRHADCAQAAVRGGDWTNRAVKVVAAGNEYRRDSLQPCWINAGNCRDTAARINGRGGLTFYCELLGSTSARPMRSLSAAAASGVHS